MRRFFMLALLFILVAPAAVFAQTTQPLWDLGGVFSVTDLGFKFNYPSGWFTQSQSGVYLAESTDDLTALTDSDDKTIPVGYTISLVALPLDAAGLKPDTTLDDAVTAVVMQSGITEQQRSELPVLSRRSISIFGLNSAGRPGIASIWLQDSNVVIFAVGAPEASADLAFSWGQILGSVTALNALELGDTLQAFDGDFTMQYPKGWFFNEMDLHAYQLKSDFSAGELNRPVEGSIVGVEEEKLIELGGKVTDLASLGAWIEALNTCDPKLVPTEHIILGQPALTYVGSCPDDNPDSWAMITVFILGDKGAMILAWLPSEKDAKAFEPTYLALLKSITATPPATK